MLFHNMQNAHGYISSAFHTATLQSYEDIFKKNRNKGNNFRRKKQILSFRYSNEELQPKNVQHYVELQSKGQTNENQTDTIKEIWSISGKRKT